MFTCQQQLIRCKQQAVMKNYVKIPLLVAVNLSNSFLWVILVKFVIFIPPISLSVINIVKIQRTPELETVGTERVLIFQNVKFTEVITKCI